MAYPTKSLVARHRAGEGAPGETVHLNELFQRHYRRVGIWCFRWTGDREAAADMAQEIFVKAYRNLESFRGDCKFTTWLYAIARNHCVNVWRSRAVRPEEVAGEDLSEIPDSRQRDPEMQIDRDHNVRVVRELMRDALDDVERQVMSLHYVDEVPLDSITRLLGLTNASGAKAYIVSARRKLTAALNRRNARAVSRTGGKHAGV